MRLRRTEKHCSISRCVPASVNKPDKICRVTSELELGEQGQDKKLPGTVAPHSPVFRPKNDAYHRRPAEQQDDNSTITWNIYFDTGWYRQSANNTLAQDLSKAGVRTRARAHVRTKWYTTCEDHANFSACVGRMPGEGGQGGMVHLNPQHGAEVVVGPAATAAIGGGAWQTSVARHKSTRARACTVQYFAA